MNVLAMSATLRRKLGTSAGDGMLTPEVLLDLLNEANTMLEAERDWPWRVTQTTFSTVAGQQEYAQGVFASAADWLRTTELRISGSEPLSLRTVLDLDVRNPSGAQGRPWEYAFHGDTLLLSPVPDAVYTMTHRYVRVPPTLALDADVPLMPTMFRYAIVWQAASLAYSRVGDDERAQLAEVAVDRWRARMLDDQRRSMGSMRVRVRAGSAL